MNRKIKTADIFLEISAAAVVISLFLLGKISLAYMLLGVAVSLSLMWPKIKKTHHQNWRKS